MSVRARGVGLGFVTLRSVGLFVGCLEDGASEL